VADIIVQVSSPGLVAYGSSSWGSESYGGFGQTDLTVGSVDAFNSTGWGRLTWGSLVWGEDFVNATVFVTTPGTPTTWGYESWGEFGWGQITGIGTDLGEESFLIDGTVVLSTNILNVTVNSVFAAANFVQDLTGNVLNITTNSVFAGEVVEVLVTTNLLNISLGDESVVATGTVNLSGVQLNTTTGSLSITADANLILNTNLLNTTVGSVDHIIDVSIEVTSPGDLPWGVTTWGYGSWGNIGGLDVEQGGEEVVVPSIEVDVIGQQLNTTIGIYSITGSANITPNTNLLTISLGNEDAVPNTQVILSTNLLNISTGFASGEVLSTISVVGVTVTSQVGRVFISAWAVVDIGVTNAWSVVDIAA
jgi:hypothetical protein